jgi:serine/threonine protein kinase
VSPACPPPLLQWCIPNGIEISAECRDLLSRMLVRNPDERITMAEIHKHPWFIANLPVEVSWALCRHLCGGVLGGCSM